MNPPAMIRSFKYNSSDHPLSYTSSCTQNGSNLDISFSSYLKPQGQKSGGNDKVTTVPVPAIDDTEISIFDAQKYFSDNGYNKRPQHESLSPHESLSVPRLSSVSSVDGYGRNFRARSLQATPTASSEASWNSQTGLLANPPGSAGVSMRNYSPDYRKKRSQGGKIWIFGRKCCCTGKKSVQVTEGSSDSEHGGTGGVNSNESCNNNVNGGTNYAYATTPSLTRSSITTEKTENSNREIHHHKAINGAKPVRLSPQIPDFSPGEAPRQQRVSASGLAGGFSFPVLDRSGGAAKPAVKGMLLTKTIMNSPDDYPPRDSLEVFQPSVSRPPSIDIPGNSRQYLNPGSPIKRVTNTDDDVGSDASSDLFEIESFSTQTASYPTYRSRDSFDEAPNFNARRFNNGNSLNNNSSNNNIHYGRRSLDEPPTPSVAATECYPPSEVSIDWSVTTAEGFDRASISNFSISASEIGGDVFFRRQLQEDMDTGGKRRTSGGGGGLLMMGCRQEKAVSVGPQPLKFLPAEGPPVFSMHVGGRPPRADKTPPLDGSHSARVSLAFAA